MEEYSRPAWELPAGRDLLLVVCIVTRFLVAPRWFSEGVRRKVDLLAARHAVVPTASITLPGIERQHAVNWPGLAEIRRIHGGQDELLVQRIRKVYGWRRQLPMNRLAPELLKILTEYQTSGRAA